MAHKISLEALDRTLHDLQNNKTQFGGAMILLAGNFRQTLPVYHDQHQPTNVTHV